MTNLPPSFFSHIQSRITTKYRDTVQSNKTQNPKDNTTTMNHYENQSEIRCSERVNISCFTDGTRHVTNYSISLPSPPMTFV